MMLLMMLLTTVTAWAETESVSYIDADGQEQTVTATVLTGNETVNSNNYIELAAGWHVVKNSNPDGVDVSYTTKIRGSSSASASTGTIHIILADNAEMTVNYSGDYAFNLGTGTDTGYALAIYGQSEGTGCLTVSSTSRAIIAPGGFTVNGGIVNATSTRSESYDTDYAIHSTGAVTINGGQVTATGGGNSEGIYSHDNITLGCRKATDFIKSNGFNGTVIIKSGLTLYDGASNYSGELTIVQRDAIAGKTLRPFSSDNLAFNNEGTEYTIKNATGWGVFCEARRWPG